MILLDTHAWVFWINDSMEELSRAAKNTIKSSDTLCISVISCWEVAMLISKERLKLNIDIQLWINQALKYPGIKLLPLSPDIAVLSTRLPGNFHGDPADRMIAATCLTHNLPLITKDRQIHDWQHIQAIW